MSSQIIEVKSHIFFIISFWMIFYDTVKTFDEGFNQGLEEYHI